MTPIHLHNVIQSVIRTADTIENRNRQAIDPDPDIALLREAAHLISHTPIEHLAKIRPFPTTPTFP